MQRLRRLVSRRNERFAERSFVVEGVRVLREALDAGAGVEAVYLDASAAGEPERVVANRAVAAGAGVFELQPGVLARVLATESPPPVAAVVAMRGAALADLAPEPPDLVVVGAAVGDPGNAGTILRSAAAAGAGAVVFCAGSVDVYNPKAVRASAGALFRVPVVSGPVAREALGEIGRWGLRRWGATARGGCDYARADLSAPAALVVGHETHGLASDLGDHLDAWLSIPMSRHVESLNVATAAGVLCFEAARQRRARVVPA
ncbi:MAG: TrmH family RNA methyltransferase [Acidimicrobiales bacterium]